MPPLAKGELPRHVQRFIEQHGLIEAPGPLLVGVSGGADSICLLYILLQLRDKLDFDVHIAHLNHGLRGAESDADADYVEGLAQKLGIPLSDDKRDVKAYQLANCCSLEEAAREVRYNFFAEVAGSIGASAVAVGHNSDDQAETILMHLIRGTGLSGLRGMQPISRRRLSSGELAVIRPLLSVSRDDIEAYCNMECLAPLSDSTNASPEYLRNRIRAEVMPLLRKYNPHVSNSLSRAARMIADDMAYLDAEVTKLWGSVVEEISNGISMNNKALADLHPALGRHLLRSALGRMQGNLRDIELVHIEGILRAIVHPAGKELSLPWGLTFLGDYEQSYIFRGENPLLLLPTLEGEYNLNVPGETDITGWRIKAEVTEHEPGVIEGGDFKAVFDFDLTGSELTLRCRRDGDRFQPLGMEQTKKLQDFMVDSKIPRVWRDRVPLVCARDRIIWVAGWRIDHRVRVTDDTRRILRLEFEMD